jgi:hypothetical protein
MATQSNAALPERVICNLMQAGVNAINADLATSPPIGESILESVLKELEDDAERTKARAAWTRNPPTVTIGYPRMDGPFPIYALVLSSDTPNQQYAGLGDHDYLDMADLVEGAEFFERNEAQFTVYCYTEHPDLTSWWYRVLRRILNVGKYSLVRSGLQEPLLSGADLIPDPQYTPDNLFGRRLTITVQYNERWTNQDPLWDALNGAPEAIITTPSQLDVRHRDSDPFPGGVTPYTEE